MKEIANWFLFFALGLAMAYSLYLRWNFESFEQCRREGYASWECKMFGLDN